ncbi:MAG: GAF domain-containing protein [Lyngbya sp. HA4199-MV5]|jgi:signal transduction histidine kinase/PAS domain-containing protein|nr:GAF domain-containing protein [Lyngbya sp. HA4199-MV5]
MSANQFATSVITPTEILEGIAAIALQSQHSVALATILQTALETTRALLHSDRVLLYRFLGEGDGIVAVESVSAEWLPLLGRVMRDTCFDRARLERFRQGYWGAIEDVADSSVSACYAALLDRLQVQAMLTIPLLTQGDVWGLLIAHQCQSTRSWHPLDVQYLQMVAVQLGIAMQLHQADDASNDHNSVDASLPRSEQWLQQFGLQSSGNIIYTLVQASNGDLWFEFINAAVEGLHEIPYTQTLENAQWLIDSIHPDDRAGYVAALAQSAQTLSAFSHEWRIVMPSGKVKWLQGHAQPQQRPDGAIAWCGAMQDMSERKRTEVVLRESEAHKTALISALPDLVIRANAQGIYLEFLATNTFRVIGKTGDFVGTHVYDSLPRDLAKQRMEAIHTALATNSIQFYEQTIAVDGETQTEEVRVVPYQVDEVLLLVRDISDRKQAEIALWQRAEREQAFSRVVKAIRQSLDLHTILTAAATEIAQLLKVDQAAVVQYLPERQCWQHVAIYKQEPDLPNHLGLEIPDQGNPFGAQLKRREIVRVVEPADISDDINQSIAQRLPGSWLLVPVIVGDAVWGSFSLLSSQKIAHWHDEQVELVQALADQLAIAIQQAALYQQVQTLNTSLELQVQERTAQLQQALNFEALLKRITDHVRDSLDEAQILQTAVQELAIELGVDCCDAALYDMERRNSTIWYENIQEQVSIGIGNVIAFASYPDLYHQLLQGQPVHCCVPTLEPDACRNIKHTSTILACPLMDERGVLGDMWLFKPQHTYFDELEIRLVQQVANQCAIALRQSRLYQAAQAQVEELERLNQLKDDFLSTVSHELRTPMSNIKMATQMLELTLKPLGVLDHEADPINRYFSIIREEGQREIGLINDLLDLTRLDAGTEPINLTSIALQPFLAHLAEPFFDRVRRQQQYLILQLPDQLPALTTDRTDLERIVTELLQNACKYTPAGEAITLSAHTTPTALTICVSNAGVEIPEIERDRIFDKFYRIPNNDPWKYGGTGLGLALVKKLAERLNASIRVTSEHQQTTFTLEFLRVT